MAGPGTTWTGPLISGDKINADGNGPANTGLAVLSQQISLTQNGATAVTGSVVLPYGAQIVDILADTTVAWNSGTSDTLTVGATAGGSDYASAGLVVTTAERTRPTYTAAQLAANLNIGANTTVYATVTPVGTAATTGATTLTILYVQKVNLTEGSNF